MTNSTEFKVRNAMACEEAAAAEMHDYQRMADLYRAAARWWVKANWPASAQRAERMANTAQTCADAQ